MYRIDHYALRVPDKQLAADFYVNQFGYKIETEFFPFEEYEGDLDRTISCYVLTPPNRLPPWALNPVPFEVGYATQPYYAPPEIFISEGKPGSIVGDWVAERGGLGSVHHFAYAVDSVKKTMQDWQKQGYEFTTEEPIYCEEEQLTQCFTKPILAIGGIIIELIERKGNGFCNKNVKSLMESTNE